MSSGPELLYIWLPLPIFFPLSYLISSFPCQCTRLTRIIRLLRRFRDCGQSGPVVFKSFVKPSCSSLSSPSLPFTIMRCSLEEINHLHLRLSYKSNCRLGKGFSLSLRFHLLSPQQFAAPSFLQSLAPSSDCNASPHSTNTTNAWNQPPFEMAGVCFLSCIRCRTKRRRRIRDLPMSRNDISHSSLTPG